MKKLLALFLSLVCFSAVADDVTPTPPPAQPRVSLFSTSVDWAAVTGLPWQQYRGEISGTSRLLVKEGLVLYYLDAFPCYGLGDGVRVWMGSNNKHEGDLRIACVYAPETIMFSYRNATRDADDARNTGMLTCPVSSDGRVLNIDMAKCQKGKDWSEYK